MRSIEALEPRLVLAGELDETFGAGGFAVTDFAGRDDSAVAVAVAPDGRIVAAGRSQIFPDVQFAVARYLDDGTLDTSFDADGRVLTNVGGGFAGAYDMVLQPDGKILVVGEGRIGATNDFTIVRYETNGDLDASFGDGGIVQTDLPGMFGAASADTSLAVTLDSQGRILVAGRAATALGSDIAIARYLPSGALDNSFGFGAGFVTQSFGGTDWAYDLVVDPADDSFVVAVSGVFTVPGSVHQFPGVMKFRANGSLDTTFGTDGVARLTINGDDVSFLEVDYDTQRRIVVSGNVRNDADRRGFVARLSAGGTIDGGFGTAGVTEIVRNNPFSGESAVTINGMAVQGERVVLTGSWFGGVFYLLLARLDSTGTLLPFEPNIDPPDANDDFVVLDLGGGSVNEAWGIALDEAGRWVVAGARSSGLSSDFVVARFEGPDATIDSDDDGVPDSTEDANPVQPSDLAHLAVLPDVPFSRQGNVLSFPNAVDRKYVTLVSPVGSSLEAGQALRPVPPGNTRMSMGAVAFEVVGVAPGGTVVVDLYVEEEVPANAYLKLAPTADDPSAHWYDFAYSASTNEGAELVDADADGRIERIRLHLTDGGPGDYDRTADGRIRDPGGLGQSSYPSGAVDLAGYKFWDLDGDGTPDAGEPRLPGWTVFLDENKNGVLDAGERSSVTDADGRFTFSGLDRRTYFVGEVQQPGWRQTSPPAFGAPVSSPLVDSGRGVAIGHLNPDEDMLPDIVGINGTFVEFLFNNADGTFSRGLIGDTGAFPETAVIEDFNNDGLPDVAVAYTGFFNAATGQEEFPAEVHVFYGSGGKEFQEPTSDNGHRYRVSGQVAGAFYGTEPYQLVAGDVNGDGLTDLVTDSRRASTLSVLFGTAGGAFRSTVDVVSLAAPAAGLAVVDLDADPALEVVVSDAASGFVTVVDNLGQASEVQEQFSAGGEPPGSLPLGRLTTGDFDGDGDADVAVLELTPGSPGIVLLRNDGAAGLSPLSGDLPVQGDPRGIQASDRDADGDLDLFVANNATGAVTVYDNSGAANFTLLGHFPVGDGPNAVAVGDLDSDGFTDIATANTVSHDVTIARGNPHQLTRVALGDDPTPRLVAIGNRSEAAGSISGTVFLDLEGDGRDANDVGLAGRLVYLDLNGNRQHEAAREPFHISEGDGGFTFPGLPPGTYEVRAQLLPGWEQTVPPADGAGGVTAISVDLAPNEQSTGNDLGTRRVPGAGQVTGNVWFDADADGNRDAGETPLPDRTVYLDLNFDGRFDPQREPNTQSDPLGNYVFANLPSDRRHVVSLLIEEDETLTVPGTLHVPNQFVAGTAPQAIATADFDLDGIVDIAAAHDGAATASVLFGHGDGSFAPPVPVYVGGAPGVEIAAMLVNDDALPDLVIARRGIDSLTVLLNRADEPGSFLFSYLVQGLNRPADLEVSDLDGDGDQDLAVANFGAQAARRVTTDPPACVGCGVSVVLNNAGTLAEASFTPMTRNVLDVALAQFGGSPALDVAAITEEVLVSPLGSTTASAADSTVEILLNAGSGELAPATTVSTSTFNLSSLTAADFNLDGDTDLAVTATTPDTPPVNASCVLLALVGVLFERCRGESDDPPGPQSQTPPPPAAPSYSTSSASAQPGTAADGYIVLVENEGNGQFRLHSSVAGALVNSISTPELDSDAEVELVVTSDQGTLIYHLPTNIFQPEAVASFERGVVVGDPIQTAAADFDADGDQDLVIADSAADGVAILRNRGDGTFFPALLRGHEITFPPAMATGKDFGVHSDGDADGIADAIEAAAPNAGDGNGDGQPDTAQQHVASLQNAVDGSYVTLEAPEGTTLVQVRATSEGPEPPPPGVALPWGVLGFELHGVAVGQLATVVVTVHAAVEPSAYYKFGPEPGRPFPQWYEFGFDSVTSTGATIAENEITLVLRDGGRGDSDGLANGIVVDPGAPGMPAPVLDGDYSGNGLVEQADLDLVLGNWGKNAFPLPPGWLRDFPAGVIDQDDLDAVLVNWGRSSAAPSHLQREAAARAQMVGLLPSQKTAAAVSAAKIRSLRTDREVMDHVFESWADPPLRRVSAASVENVARSAMNHVRGSFAAG